MEQSLELLEDDLDFELERSTPSTENVYSPLICLYVFFLFMFQTLFRLSDTAMNILLKFLSMFFKTLRRRIPSIPEGLTTAIPESLYSARKVSNNTRDQFKRYVCCPCCSALYSFEDCVAKLPNGQLESKNCSFVRFPNHTRKQY